MKRLAAVLLAAAVSTGAQAEGPYAGGGIGFNSIDVSGFDSAIGFQFFGGYDLDIVLGENVTTAVEVGYKMSGDFDYNSNFVNGSVSLDGLWFAGVARHPINDQVSLLGRLGLDLGDDDGLLFGFGGEYTVSDQVGVRAEYIIRSDTSALEFNLTYRL